MDRKGEVNPPSEGRFIASLILVIAILMILYVLFIPPSERQELLNTNSSSSFDRTASDKIELLSESPGLVSPNQNFGVVHQLPSVNIFVKTEPKVLTLAQSLTVRNSLFSKTFPTTTFESRDSDLKKVSLAFSVNQPSGELRIFLNGNQFYAEEVMTSGVKVVDVPLNLLSERNRVDFEVSSPGLAFWRTNKYQLTDITLREEFERIHAQETRQFTLTSEERENLQSAQLSYFQFCNLALAEQTAALKVYVNDNSVFSGLIRCISSKQTLELDKSVLVTGVNNVRFLLEQGDFTFNEVQVETKSKDRQNPTYLFSLTRSQFNDLQIGNRSLELQLFLEEAKAEKRARIMVNEADFFMNTEDNSFTQNLREYVVEGTNFIRIIPSNTFNIVGLKVVLDNDD